MPDRVYINCAFADQKITGQQRYAQRISSRLPSDWIRVRPTGVWSRSAMLTWCWVLMVLPWITRRGVLVSLTARAPVWHPWHLLAVHDLFVIDHPEWFSTKYARTHGPLLRHQLRTARALVAVSEPVAATVRDRYRRDRVDVAPNAPDDEPGNASREGDAAMLSAQDLTAGRYFVVVGSQEPRKNLPMLAAAYRQLDQQERSAWPLVVVGGTSTVFRSGSVEWPAETLIVGYVSDDELSCLYRNSGAVLLASLDEGFGLPLVEAAAAGAPRLVVSDIPVFRWVCGGGATFVPPTHVTGWVEALRRVIRDEAQRCDPQLAATYSWDASARVYAELVQQRSAALVGARPPGVANSR